MRIANGMVVTMLMFGLACSGTFGCNTVRGAGKDIQKGGRAIEDAAENTQVNTEQQRANPNTIVASSDSGGTISPSGNTSVAYGADHTFDVNASRGFHVADVLVDGESVGAVSRHTFDNVTVNHTISAVFTPDPVQ